MLGSEMTHLVAGGIGGTVAALITSPLEVVKVRLQASAARVANFDQNSEQNKITSTKYNYFYKLFQKNRKQSFGVIKNIKLIVATEGKLGLFRGVVPTLVGVIPSRSIYFWAYNYAQSYFNEIFVPYSNAVFFCSAALSSGLSSTVTNPIWFIKTRLQLDFGAGKKKLKVWKIVKDTYQTKGIRGFFRGVTASYAGISETGIHFMIYESLKIHFINKFHNTNISKDISSSNNNHISKLQNYTDMFGCMGASMISKTISTTLAYPHEVARTRLREEGTKYRGFFQTIHLVYREEGILGLYRGLTTHYLRQVPNTCIIIGVYEGTVLLFDRWGLVDPKTDD
uniref:Slc25a-29 n=1 Tax=Schmidtea mediterranea TaxID=79327 RepID=A0A0H3YFG0_SCHMD|nr:slc25a-29 [Schmidtea mediterranea]